MTAAATRNPPRPYTSVSEVCPGLFMGARPPKGEALRRLGFTMLVLCASEHQPRAENFPGVRVLFNPLTEDENAATALRRVCPVAQACAAEIRRGGRVLITCSWGYNRSGITTALTLRKLYPRKTGEEVVAELRRIRPKFDGLHALGIPAYVEAVKQGCP